jgi:hypothetical protein
MVVEGGGQPKSSKCSQKLVNRWTSPAGWPETDRLPDEEAFEFTPIEQAWDEAISGRQRPLIAGDQNARNVTRRTVSAADVAHISYTALEEQACENFLDNSDMLKAFIADCVETNEWRAMNRGKKNAAKPNKEKRGEILVFGPVSEDAQRKLLNRRASDWGKYKEYNAVIIVIGTRRSEAYSDAMD